MRVEGNHFRSIWFSDEDMSVNIVDQSVLPHRFVIRKLNGLSDVIDAINLMRVRGAPLIGATAAYGVCLAAKEDSSDNNIKAAYEKLIKTRPTAVNLKWALDEMLDVLLIADCNTRVRKAYEKAGEICESDIENNQLIGEYGLEPIATLYSGLDKSRPLNILTHCNAGWLATVDHGTALAPVYKAYEANIPIHVWVDETRPRNQGASLTAWELGQHGVPHTIIADNAAGHLMQNDMVDVCIVGSDRTTSTGDVCNKIGTYIKALAAYDNDIPFYVALPSSTIDWNISDGFKEIEIEERAGQELSVVTGVRESGEVVSVNIYPPKSNVSNFAFDVTPSKYVTGLITERGICNASRQGLSSLFSDLLR